MRLHLAAQHFNRMPCNDGYTGAFLYNGQLGLFDDSKRDSESQKMRWLAKIGDSDRANDQRIQRECHWEPNTPQP